MRANVHTHTHARNLRSVHRLVTLGAHNRRSALATMSANFSAAPAQVQVACYGRRLATMQARTSHVNKRKSTYSCLVPGCRHVPADEIGEVCVAPLRYRFSPLVFFCPSLLTHVLGFSVV